MNKGDQLSAVGTRSKTKLKLVVENKDFAPPRRSTELLQTDPFSRKPRLSHSPPASPSSILTDDNFLNIPSSTKVTDKLAVPLLTTSRPTTPDEHLEVEILEDVEENIQFQTENTANTVRPLTIRRLITATMANITLQESMSTEKIPATPKFLCPSIFNPSTDDALQFLKQYDRTSVANGWNNAMKITYLPTFLEGAANHWFDQYKEDDDNNQKTWAEIKEDFLREFGTHNPRGFLEGQLYARKQKINEGVREYYYNLLALFGEYDPTLNIQNFKKFFENGMNKDLYTHYRLIMDDEPTWTTFKKAVEKLNDISRNIPEPKAGTCNCRCEHTSSNEYTNRNIGQNRLNTQRYSRPPPRQGNYPQPSWQYNQRQPEWRENNPRYGNTGSLHLQPGQFRRPNGWYTQQNSRENPGLNTRNHDGRPKCYKCNRLGHHPSTCQANPRNPNYGGRRM